MSMKSGVGGAGLWSAWSWVARRGAGCEPSACVPARRDGHAVWFSFALPCPFWVPVCVCVGAELSRVSRGLWCGEF
jgi:hypothetical protein